MAKIYLLSNSFYEGVDTLPMIDINYLDINFDLSSYDTLIFTSKNSVLSIKNNPLWRDKECYAISEQTAKLISSMGGKLKYTGKSRDGNEFAKEIVPLLKNKKVLYLRAKEVVSNLATILKNKDINLDELIVYETLCKEYKNTKLEEGSIFIFTSPSTIECFFKSFSWQDSFKAVCIGITTAKALPGNIKAQISKEKSIKSCIELAKGL